MQAAPNQEKIVKAMVQDEYGPPAEVVRLDDVEIPAMKDDQVLVRVHAAAVNWADWSMVRGLPYVMRAGYGTSKPRGRIRGMDVAGTVDAVGAEVTSLNPGDEVYGWCQAAFAEYASVEATHLVPKPVSITFGQAAGVPMAGLVALQALRDIGNVEAGQKVLVVGASGGIGTFTVQIAKAFGAEVTGVCSTDNLELVRSLGADHVIDYTQEDFTKGGERYDFILDIADRHTLSERRKVLTPTGTLVPNSGEGGKWFASVGRILRARALSPFVSQNLRPFLSMGKHDDLVALNEMIEAGTVTPVVGKTYPLAEAGEAIAYCGAGHGRGKTVVIV